MPRLLSVLVAVTGLFMSAALSAQAAQPPRTVAQADLRVAPPPPPLTPENSWVLDLSTGGRVVIQLRPDVTPQTVERIKTLTRQGFYNGLTFFRVIEGFMAQGGDPQNVGTGASTLPDLPAEINGLPHLRGSVAMARTAADLNSANSQFYIMFVPRLQMDRSYTVFGRVVSGMQFVETIERGEPPPAPSRIVRASLGSDNLPEMSAEQLRAAAAQLAATSAPTPGGVTRNAAVGPAVPPPPAAPRALEPVRAPNARPRN
jgi:cyclophilin family peptidyl-prolyl cis-trans isomerase